MRNPHAPFSGLIGGRAARAAGFTLIEMMMATGMAALMGGVILSVLNIGMTLYAQNVSINRTHAGGLFTNERLFVKIAAAAEKPTLVDDSGTAVSGNGPAAGVHIYVPTSPATYTVPSAVTATAGSFAITKSSSQPPPRAGDKVTMFDLGFQGVITGVSGSGNSFTISFASTVGNGFSPPLTAGTVIPAGGKFLLLTPSAFISVSGQLRYYPRARSVAQDGAGTFHNPASFDPMTLLLPTAAQTNAFPFSRPDASGRSVDVNLRVRAPAHGGRLSGFYTFQNVRTTVTCRSVMNQ